MSDQEKDFPPEVHRAVETIVNATPTSCRNESQRDNLTRLKAYISTMIRGPKKGRHGRPKTKMDALIMRHLKRLSPEGGHVKMARLKVSIGSYRSRDEFKDAMDKMIEEGVVTQDGDHVWES